MKEQEEGVEVILTCGCGSTEWYSKGNGVYECRWCSEIYKLTHKMEKLVNEVSSQC